MRVPVLELPTVFHIGTLDPALRGAHHHSTSQEGAGLSVSLCPAAWRRIARLGGTPLQQLSREGALFLDLHGMDDVMRDAVSSWAEAEDLARREVRFLAWSFDDESDRWHAFSCGSREEAIGELADDLDGDEPTKERLSLPEEDGGPPGGSLVSEEVSLMLTEAGVARASGYQPGGDATDIAAMFYAEDVLRPEMPELVGVWWRDDYDPMAYTAPKGAILPCCVQEFVAEENGWNVLDDEELLEGMPEVSEIHVVVLVPMVCGPR